MLGFQIWAVLASPGAREVSDMARAPVKTDIRDQQGGASLPWSEKYCRNQSLFYENYRSLEITVQSTRLFFKRIFDEFH